MIPWLTHKSLKILVERDPLPAIVGARCAPYIYI